MEAKSPISDFMTPCPVTAHPGATVTEALKTMEDNDIRHLPVADKGRVIGLLSEREIKRYELLMDTTRTLVADVMVREPFTAKKNTPLAQVVLTMAKNKFGSTVVLGHGEQIVGIFTSTDALELFAKNISK